MSYHYSNVTFLNLFDHKWQLFRYCFSSNLQLPANQKLYHTQYLPCTKSRIVNLTKWKISSPGSVWSKMWLTWFSRELVRSRLPPLSTLSARLPASPSSLSWDFLHFHIFLPKIILIYYFHSPTWVEPFLHLSLRILLLLSLSSEGGMFLLCLRIPLLNYY